LHCSENVPRLHEFAARFTTRFIELMSDVDEGVAAAALHLLAQLVQHGVLKHEVRQSSRAYGGWVVVSMLTSSSFFSCSGIG
jgi:Zn-dependent M16 (insulinase) family peptidase